MFRSRRRDGVPATAAKSNLKGTTSIDAEVVMTRYVGMEDEVLNGKRVAIDDNVDAETEIIEIYISGRLGRQMRCVFLLIELSLWFLLDVDFVRMSEFRHNILNRVSK